MRRNSFTGPIRTLSETTEIGNNLLSIINNRQKRNIHLEEEIDVNKDLEIYKNQELNLLSPKKLYHVGILQSKT